MWDSTKRLEPGDGAGNNYEVSEQNASDASVQFE
jgi:hypothetical protein